MTLSTNLLSPHTVLLYAIGPIYCGRGYLTGYGRIAHNSDLTILPDKFIQTNSP